MKSITIIVSPDGATKIETSGFTGTSCSEASLFIESALGHKTSEQFKPEYFQTENQNLEHKELVQC